MIPIGPSATLAPMDVVEISTADTYALRRRVLREDSPDPTAVRVPGDDDAGTVHLGVRDGDTLVAISTWVVRDTPDGASPAVQLRAMAVDESCQGTGIGAVLLAAGVDRAVAGGATVDWANPRDTALGFYDRAGFSVVGDGFVDATTGLPHHVVTRT